MEMDGRQDNELNCAGFATGRKKKKKKNGWTDGRTELETVTKKHSTDYCPGNCEKLRLRSVEEYRLTVADDRKHEPSEFPSHRRD